MQVSYSKGQRVLAARDLAAQSHELATVVDFEDYKLPDGERVRRVIVEFEADKTRLPLVQDSPAVRPVEASDS